MNIFWEVTWPQLILIEIGAILLFVALCEFVRETKSSRLRRSTREKITDTRAQAQKLAEQEILLRAIHAGPVAPPHHEHNEAFHETPAAQLVKTARVKFQQGFKFREQE